MSKRYFIICSMGEAGSVWLANTLDLHDSITCSQGTNHPIISMMWRHMPVFDREALKKLWMDHIKDPEDIKFGINKDDASGRDLVSEILQDNQLETSIAVRQQPIQLNDLFEELDRFYPATILGNVHAYTIHQFSEQLRNDNCLQPVVFNLIRHPITRFHATLNRNYLYNVSDPVKRKKITENVFNDSGLLQAWANELVEFPDAIHLPMERLIHDPDYFSAIFLLICGRTPSQAYIDQIFSDERKSFGRANLKEMNKPSPPPKEVFVSWPRELKNQFRDLVVSENYEQVYKQVDYDFSFVK